MNGIKKIETQYGEFIEDFVKKNLHENAKQFINDDSIIFKRNPSDIPFGDDGIDVFYALIDEINKDPNLDLNDFVVDLLDRWDFFIENAFEADEEKLKFLIPNQLISGSMIFASIFIGIDNAIISTYFIYFCLLGKHVVDFEESIEFALNRQLLSVSINSFNEDFREGRLNRIKELQSVYLNIKRSVRNKSV